MQSAWTWASINLDSISTKSGFIVSLHDRALSPPLKSVFFFTNSFLFRDEFPFLSLSLFSSNLLVLRFFYTFLSDLRWSKLVLTHVNPGPSTFSSIPFDSHISILGGALPRSYLANVASLSFALLNFSILIPYANIVHTHGYSNHPRALYWFSKNCFEAILYININKTFNFLRYDIFLDQHRHCHITRLDHAIACRKFASGTEVIFNVTKRRIRSKSVMDHEIESMNSCCLASLRISRPGNRAQLVITTRRQPMTLPTPSSSTCISGYFRKKAVRITLIRSHLCCWSAQSSLVPYMQIPIARKIDYP